eukprot:GHVQ01023445.1.p1 GENE.GHVQ01023445.1~~GHVQ01023445.1.p1  ORF type:complete len:150 (-),score=21.18 GHVQ01023445.1:210-659(-)
MAFQSGASLQQFLNEAVTNDQERTLLSGLFGCISNIATYLRGGAQVQLLSSHNEFGEQQLSVDVAAENIFREFAESDANKSIVRGVSSEERTELSEVSANGEYVLCWDPLDGSSIVDSNFAVGSIIGIWKLSTGLLWDGPRTLIGKTGK